MTHRARSPLHPLLAQSLKFFFLEAVYRLMRKENEKEDQVAAGTELVYRYSSDA